jgi:hypothetical protein
LRGGIQAQVFDFDYDFNDPMGLCTIPVTDDLFSDTPFDFSCSDGVGWSASFRIRAH